MEISNEKCSAADGIYQMTTKVCRDRRTTRLVELDWFACTPRTVLPLPPPLHPVPRSGIWDLGCPIHIKSFCQEENTRNPQKNPTPGLWHRRRRCCCAEPEYQLHTWLISSCQWLLHPRSLLDLKMQPFLTLFCMILFSSRIAADFCLTCTSLVQSALASDSAMIFHLPNNGRGCSSEIFVFPILKT